MEQSHKYFVFINGTLQRIRKGGKSNQLCIPETQVPMYLARIHGENRTPFGSHRNMEGRSHGSILVANMGR